LVHLHSPADVRQLAPLVHELLTRLGQFRDITLDPEYFLLSLPPHWSAEVLAFFDGTTLQAVLYGRRRKVGGWGTGFLNGGDAVGGGCLAGDPAVLPTVVRQAADYYFKKRVHALRWSLPSPPRQWARLKHSRRRECVAGLSTFHRAVNGCRSRRTIPHFCAA